MSEYDHGPTTPLPGVVADRPGRNRIGIRSAKAKFGAVVIVCAKCAKRQSVSAKAVGKLLKQAYADVQPEDSTGKGRTKDKRRKLRVIDTGCLGPCPKRAVAVGTPASLATGRVKLLDLAAGRENARALLLPEFGPIAGLDAGEDTTDTGKGPTPSP